MCNSSGASSACRTGSKNIISASSGELAWIRGALRIWRKRDEKKIPDPELTDQMRTARKDLVRRLWVRAQLQYFAEVAGPREERWSDRCKRWGAILFWTSLVLAVILALCEVWHLAQPPPDGQCGLPHEESILICVISILLAVAAIAVAYGDKMAFSEHARHYRAMSILFFDTDRKLTTGPLIPAETDELRKLGKEALQENGDWLLLHRDRPLEIIVP